MLNKNRWAVTLPSELVTMCLDYGHGVVARLKRQGTKYEGEDLWNPVHQANAKGAEVSFCMSLLIDPIRMLDWQTENCGADWDVKVCGKRIDVKWMEPAHRLLTWPRGKVAEYDLRQFDYLVWVRGELPSYEAIRKLSKAQFLERKRVAGEGHSLWSGTWYVPEEEGIPIKSTD